MSTTSKQSMKSKLALIFTGATLAVSAALPAQAQWNSWEHPFYNAGRALASMGQQSADKYCRQMYDHFVIEGKVPGGATNVWAHLDAGECVYNK